MASVDRGATTLRTSVQAKRTIAGQPTNPRSMDTGSGTYGGVIRSHTFVGNGWGITDRETSFMQTPLTRSGTRQAQAPAGVIANRQYNTANPSHSASTISLSMLTSPWRDTRHVWTMKTTALAKSSGGAASIIVPPASNVVTYYKMRARDPDCGTLTYRTWIVLGAPDNTAVLYSGPRCGPNPLVDIHVDAMWEVTT